MINDTTYFAELKSYVVANELLLRRFNGSKFLISGAAGLIGSYLIDLLIVAKRELGIHLQVCACDRDSELLMGRFSRGCADVVECHAIDICRDSIPDVNADYVIHAASNTSPVDYATRPIDTIKTNAFGTDVLCDYAVKHRVKRILLCSSVEAYGRNNGDVDAFSENYSGYVDSNTLRANYPSAKRCSEALCNAYAAEHPDFDFVIARIGRIYGPTVILSDSKAPTQFIRNAVNRENVVLKSSGTQLYSWGYVGDCATALLTILDKGDNGGAYNVSDPLSCKTLREFAAIAAHSGDGELVFAEQSDVERSGYSTITKATLDTSKLESLGWRARHHLDTGIPRTVEYLRKMLKHD